MVYLFKSQNIYKIGKAIDVKKRYETLLTGNPYLEIVCFGDAVKEKDLHNYFSNKKIKNEWFALSEKDVELAFKFITTKDVFVPKNKNKTSGNRFYRISKNGKERFYKNLKKLCENENLNYTNVHYELLRKNNLTYSQFDILIELKQFE